MGDADGPIRHLLGSSRQLTPEDRLDRLVQALAQGPPDSRLDLWGDGPDRRRLERLCRAHGLEERVRFVDPSDRPDDEAVPVYPSGANLRTALLPPGERDSLALTTAGDRIEAVGFGALVERLYGPDDPPNPVPTGDDSVLRGSRIAVVTNIPTHYRVPLFDAVARRVERAGGAFRALFLARSYRRRAWMRPAQMGFDHQFLRSVGLPLGHEWHPFVPRDLGAAVDRFDPTLVVVGGFSPAVAGRMGWIGRRPLAIWSGETPSLAPGWPVRPFRRSLAGRAVAGLAYGAASAEYLATLAPSLPGVIVRNTTPVPPPGEEIPDDQPRILTVADLSSPRKGVDILLTALSELVDLPWRLTVVGGGPELPRLRALAAERGIAERVVFTGPVPSGQVAPYYARAQIFALASRREIFGLVLVEAMASGLAVAVSSDVGAVEDLCEDGVNAAVVRPNVPSEWKRTLAGLLRNGDRRASLAAAARVTASRRWTMSHSADAFVAGLRLGLLVRASA